MKTSQFIIVLVLFAFFSCKKETTIELLPTAEISIGHITGWSNTSKIVNYANQDSMYAASLDTSITIEISEKNIRNPKLNNLDPLDLEFSLHITTSEDNEVFVSSKNAFCFGSGLSKNNGGICSISSILNIPLRISNKIEKQNNKMEVKEQGDYIKISYQSNYSGLILEKTLKIKSFK